MSAALTGLIGAVLGASISLIGQWLVQKSNIQADTRKQRFDAYLNFFADSSLGCRLANSLVENQQSWSELLQKNLDDNKAVAKLLTESKQAAKQVEEFRAERPKDQKDWSPEDVQLSLPLVAKSSALIEQYALLGVTIEKNERESEELKEKIPALESGVGEFLAKMDSSLFKMELISPPHVLKCAQRLRAAIDRRAAMDIASADLESLRTEFSGLAQEDLNHSTGWGTKKVKRHPPSVY